MPASPLEAGPPVGARASRRPVVTVDRAALQANWRMLAAHAPGARTGAAVKANGYGLGAPEVGLALHEAGCRDFFVAWADEGAALREALATRPASIFVLQGFDRRAAELAARHDLTPVLSTAEDVRLWEETALSRNRTAALQLETGMNRLGLGERDAAEAAELVKSGQLRVSLVMSHLASADEPASPQNRQQLDRFKRLSALFPDVERSLANSAGIFLGSDYAFDLTRPGIALYGGSAGPASEGKVTAVATLTASVLQIRSVEAGEAAGYGAAARLDRDTRIATVGLGYADGFPRAGSGAGVHAAPERPSPMAFLKDRLVPILGRVSMDLILLDVTDLPENAVRPGDRAEFFGRNLSISRVAASAGTIDYELLTSLGPRVARQWQ